MFDDLRQKVFDFESNHGVVEIDSLRESNQASFRCIIEGSDCIIDGSNCVLEGCGCGCEILCAIQSFD